jgi:hypothetical protein
VFCPKCGAEYRPGFSRCTDCNVELTESPLEKSPGPPEPESHKPLVPIYVCHNPAELPVVKSLLTQAGIEFMVRGEQIQGMFGVGQLGGTSLIVPLEIRVLPSDAEAAVELLEGVFGPSAETSV